MIGIWARRPTSEGVAQIGAAHRGVGARARPAWQRPDVLLAVSVGGVLGSLTRYVVGELLPTPEHGFPWSTLLVNVSGALLLGTLVVLLLERFPADRYARAFLGTGFLGAYTTFSTYLVETVLLARDGYVTRATAYLLGSLVVGLLAAWLGIVIGRSIVGRGAGP
jgi:CrcB protein